jgi:FHS family L-fucose permease-like MFS transporter
MTARSAARSLFRGEAGRSYALPFLLVCSLFLLWGLCNGMIDVLNKHFQNSLHVSKAESALVQFSNYMGYFLMAVPSGMLARRFGYKGGIIVGLALIAVGAFWFIPATRIGTFGAFLIGLFILASGLTCLETVANPYATALGPPELAAARITLAQSCNGVGWILGPLVGGHFVLSATAEVNRSNGTLYLPYLGIGLVVTVLLVIFLFSGIPEVSATAHRATPDRATPDRVSPDRAIPDRAIPDRLRAGDRQTAASAGSIWRRPHFVAAVVAQFLYVAAQTGIFSFFINYLVSDLPRLGRSTAALLPGGWTYQAAGGFTITERAASQLLSLGGFGLFLLGRLTGSLVLSRFAAERTLALYAAANVLVIGLVMAPLGWISVASLFASFFFMSIMFPTIFALGIHGLGAETKRASAFIVMAIVGGAVMPLAMGWLADVGSMRAAFVVPMLCFAGIAAYGGLWPRLLAGERRSGAR